MSNPYQATAMSITRASTSLVSMIAFLSVMGVAALCSLIGPAVAYFIGNLPTDANMAILRISLSACISFGLAVGIVAARFATRKTGILSVLMFLSVFLFIIPLAYSPQAAGPIVDYTAVALGCTIFAALLVGLVLRQWTRADVE